MRPAFLASALASLLLGAFAMWWTACGVLALGLLRDVTKSQLAVGGLLLAGLTLVQLAGSQLAWDAFSASPLAPFALVAVPVIAGRRGLDTHAVLGLCGCLAWPLLGLVLVRRRTRFATPI